MIRLRSVAALAIALLAGPVPAALDVHDTLVSGVPWVSISARATVAKKGARPDPAMLRIDRDRGVARARLTPSKGPSWTFWDGNPFAREGAGTTALVLPARIVGKALLLARDSRPARLVNKPQPAPTTATPKAAPAPDTAKLPAPSADTATTPDTLEAAPVDKTGTPAQEPTPPVPTAVVPAETTATEPGHASSDIKGADGVFTVVIDAGHGGKDPGAMGQKVSEKVLQEKDATLGIALKLRDELRGMKGIRVVMTRETDVFLTLGERTRKANEAKGDLFVSIHCNSLPLNSPRRDAVEGFMVYLLREAQSEADRAIERRENEAIRFETGERQRKDALSPVEWMLLEHQLNQFTKESERFAGLVVGNLSTKGPVKKERKGAGQAGFFVLVGALMPSVLIETGYVSHPTDASNLGTDAGRKAIARQIARSIDEFRRSGR